MNKANPALQHLITKFLSIYPKPLRQLLSNSVFMAREERYRNNKRIDGSYDAETGEIILWNPHDCNENDFFIILTHEWGHKFYHEGLSDLDKANWLKIRTQESIDFDLNKSYSAIQLPEEEYCTVFSIVSKSMYLEKIGMKVMARKMKKKMREQFPRSSAIVESHISHHRKRSRSSPAPTKKTYDITRQEVKKINAWIQDAIRN